MVAKRPMKESRIRQVQAIHDRKWGRRQVTIKEISAQTGLSCAEINKRIQRVLR